MQCACTVFSYVVCPAVQYFSTFSHKRQDFSQKVSEHKMCVFILPTTFIWNFFHYKKNWARCDKNVYCSSRKVTLFLPDFNETWIMLTDFQKYSNIKFQENPCSGSRVVPCGKTDRRTDMKRIVPLREFANAPRMRHFCGNVGNGELVRTPLQSSSTEIRYAWCRRHFCPVCTQIGQQIHKTNYHGEC